ncbi:MAG: helix-turn-helix domain-containing protein [bacterium]
MIEELLTRNEDKTLDFKESTQSLPSIVKTVVAFANTAGGILVIGVQDRTKKIVGVPNALDEEERLANVISDSIVPFLVPNIEIQTYRKKELILIHVPHVAGPYYVKSAGTERGVFVRCGSTSRVADAEMLETLRLYTKKISFDEISYGQAKTNALDWDVIKKLFEQVDKKITERKAEDLGLLVTHASKTSPSFGGIILFGSNRLRVFPDAIIRCVRFIGTNKAHVLDHIELDSYPVLALDQAIHFIEKNTLTSAKIGRTKRTDIKQYPPVAIREALVNALLHADYAAKGASIMIAVFDDRIEITSPGGVPLGMTLERALAGSSRVRNRVIARVFRELKLSEQWGSGLQRIIDSCEQKGLESPKFEDLITEFKVTLYAREIRSISIDASQKEFIGYLKKKEKISTKQAAEFFGIAPRNARVKLKKLVDSGLIKKIGTSAKDPHGRYVLAQGLKKAK